MHDKDKNGKKASVIITAKGEIKILEFKHTDGKEFFDSLKEDGIHCEWAESVELMPKVGAIGPIHMILNENGYTELGHDPNNVNLIATWLYNIRYGFKDTHYILGDIALCTEQNLEDGSRDFSPFNGNIANAFCLMAKEWKKEAEAKYEKPSIVPTPFVSIIPFG